MTDQGQHNGTVSHTGNSNTLGSYQHERSNTIVVSMAGSSAANNATQMKTDSTPHDIQPPAYDQNEIPLPVGKLFNMCVCALCMYVSVNMCMCTCVFVYMCVCVCVCVCVFVYVCIIP